MYNFSGKVRYLNEILFSSTVITSGKGSRTPSVLLPLGVCPRLYSISGTDKCDLEWHYVSDYNDHSGVTGGSK